VPLDQFKTQVLLLHSEQSTLDNLSSGFGASYTVHCATSGSEALNTLVDTPIDVIVSAQDLPGMSGLEALREAKKRSPDTIGILLAGDAGGDLEALVGDKEVFQIVRGKVTSDAVLALVDDATQQVRLTTLGESANDTAADGDEAPSEHIVMETAENGSSIISDGTGRMRALNQAGGSAAQSVGSRSVDLLVLTKDQEFLDTIKESSRSTHTVHYATTLAQATDTIREHKVGVAVVDAAMIGDRVEQLTVHLRKASSRLVAIVAGRREDGEMLMDLINRGKVYRFLLKPVSPGRARLAVEASVKHHLEAPDSAFKPKSAALTQPTRKPAPAAGVANKPDPRPVRQPPAQPKPPSTANVERPVAKRPAPSAAPAAAAATVPTPNSPAREPLVSDDLADAFGEDDSSFTETVAGLIGSVTKKFSGDGDTNAASPKTRLPEPESELTPSTSSSDGTMLLKYKKPGIAVVALLMLAGVTFWLMSGSNEVSTLEQSPPRAAALTEAGDPLEFDGDVQQALRSVESALLESQPDDAAAALQRVRAIDPDNARLPFLMAQVTQMQMRTHLANARTAIREFRFDDADEAIASARLLGVADTAEIDAVANELSVLRGAQRADDVLAMAEARLDDNALLDPPNDNARYYYELVLSIDPENTVANQGLGVVASKLALQARSDIDNGNYESAQDLLNEASTIDPENREVAAAISALAKGRDDALARQQEVAAEQRAADKRAADKRAADKRAADKRAADKRAAERRADEERTAAEQQADEDPVAALAAQPDAATPVDTEAANESANEMADAVAEEAPVVEKLQAPAEALEVAFAAVSSLNRKKYVAPKYPRAAQRRNLSGWVDVVFTVSTDGSVKDVSVRDSEPGETFVNAATRAVEKWEFEPVVENGATVEKRVGVRMMFALE